jgi:hypothetical protein
MAISRFPDERGAGGAEACRTGTFTWKVTRWLEGPDGQATASTPSATRITVGSRTWEIGGTSPRSSGGTAASGDPVRFSGRTDQGRLIRFDLAREPERHLENLFFRTDADCQPPGEVFVEPFEMWVTAKTVPIVEEEIHDGFWFLFLFAWIDGSIGPREATGTVTTGWAFLDPDTEAAVTCASGDRAWSATPVEGSATTSSRAAGAAFVDPGGSGWAVEGP